MLYDAALHVKLCDFAFSTVKALEEEQAYQSQCGTPAWMAPEVLRGNPYTKSADTYSFGVILWELASRKRPFAEIGQFEITIKVGGSLIGRHN
eukprot:SAG22_NODE_246_length_13948_cov_12.055744_13_plen_93_part_00